MVSCTCLDDPEPIAELLAHGHCKIGAVDLVKELLSSVKPLEVERNLYHKAARISNCKMNSQ